MHYLAESIIPFLINYFVWAHESTETFMTTLSKIVQYLLDNI